MIHHAQRFVDVILPLPLPGKFTYSVPEEMNGELQPGVRVIVQFGKKKFYSALVHRIHNDEPTGYEIKSVETILDKQPVVHPELFEFWEWIASYYHCSLGEVMKAALPSGLKLESETRVIFNPEYETDKDELSSREHLLLTFLRNRKISSVSDLNRADQKGNAYSVIKSLLNRGAISVEESLRSGYKPRTETYVRLAEEYSGESQLTELVDDLSRAPKQQELLMRFLEYTRFGSVEALEEYNKKLLLKKVGTTTATLNTLIQKGIFESVERRVDRISQYAGNIRDGFELSLAQEKAYTEIEQHLEDKQVTLLHGITSSGKTEIYIRLIEKYIQEKKQVLYLLPEIALTTQIVQRLNQVFGDKAGIYHSRFNDAERVEIWNKVLNFNPESDENQYQVIIGARSSVFLPFRFPGLIIVDEEHENSYKQFDPAPRYHARDAAIVLSHLTGAKVLLGTATPAIESYYNALTGKYGLVELSERFQQIELPKILTADLRDAYKRKQMRGHFTPLLFEEIEKALEAKEQVILFQNRRGFAPFIECKTCGWVPKCKHCDVSLTYHKHNNSLVCHYCGYTLHHPSNCQACGSAEITTKGFGTEKIEDEVSLIFPDARIARMDLDTTRARKSFEKIIHDYDSGKIDILIGTQMVTKGLDFQNVSIVGILNADNLLNYPDFRAYERSYQLMAQVSGRAGRKRRQGKVIIQTSEPDHHIIQQVIENDYTGMYKGQLAERKHFKYPPYYRLIGLVLKHRDKRELERIANQLGSMLRRSFRNRVLGPEDPVINRIQTWYIKQFWLKIERDISIVSAKKKLQEILDEAKTQPGNSGVQINIDVDPM
ncbi:replication restart helicase PriA [Prolixibacter denitrificans]|uniref:Replication restart protein PriA n=1 Tax=Prolixibacter denitrificans TaxID=1541063 RepID=A0A2P8CK28_9BACT|nr:primosomal protein N' [Prolixibacter denitrificans]PSK85326.1 replication restart DNA helicase PriA [Prolixibacter denitrificans]GET19946.1 primosomal protein N' [Prolixibacter denitrificans]